MIGWSGRTLGKFTLPTKQRAVGAWNGEEAAKWLSVDRWPILRIKYTNVPGYVDTTVLGNGRIDVAYSYEGFLPESLSFFWQKAVRPEGAATPWTPPENAWQYLPPDYGPQQFGMISLTLSGRLRVNDRDYYRCVLKGGLKTLPSPAIQNQHDVLLINWNRHPENVSVPDQSDATFNAEAQAIGQFYGRDYSAETNPSTGERLLKLQYERRVFLATNLSQGQTGFTVFPNFADLKAGDPLVKNPDSGSGDFGSGAAVQGVSGITNVVSTVPHSASGSLSFYGPWGNFISGPNGEDTVLSPVQFGLDQYLFRARAYIQGRTEPVFGNPVSNQALLDVT